MPNLIQTILDQEVQIPTPAQVYIAPDVIPEQIEAGVTLHAGCRIEGADTWIGQGTQVGSEGPAVLKNCKLGRNVVFAGGFANQAVMLDGASAGLGAHFRAGTLLEEKASVAHTVGLKQTILMPYVTLGSLINFCDILMAGGTDSKNHSEVGSSYIHFNYTPQQDKATPSLIGDVPRGISLKQAPIFLGGQGGLVGPCRIEYGTIIAAGSVCRSDLLEEGQLHQAASPSASSTVPYDSSTYRKVDRKIRNNLHFIGNLNALKAWYGQIRIPYYQADPFELALMKAALELIDEALAERYKRMDQFIEKLSVQYPHEPQYANATWENTKQAIRLNGSAQGTASMATELLQTLQQTGEDYLTALVKTDHTFECKAREWLATYVNNALDASN